MNTVILQESAGLSWCNLALTHGVYCIIYVNFVVWWSIKIAYLAILYLREIVFVFKLLLKHVMDDMIHFYTRYIFITQFMFFYLNIIPDGVDQ